MCVYYAHAYNNTHIITLTQHTPKPSPTIVHAHIHVATHMHPSFRPSTCQPPPIKLHSKKRKETREKIKWKKGDIGIREKAHKQDTSQTQQPHSTIVTSAPTSPFQLQRKSHSTTTSQIQNMHASLQPLHSYPEQKK